jgi:hypothetical protein
MTLNAIIGNVTSNAVTVSIFMLMAISRPATSGLAKPK